jgi:4-amino-4-deoxy-L-arabinose transferase-like glycosyltransferase
MGLLGWLNLGVFILPAVATSVAALRRLSRGTVAAELPIGPPTSSGDRWLSSRWLWLAAPAVVFLVLGGMLPPVDFDVREYHLQAPKEFFQNGRIAFLPHNVYAQMPMGAHLHSLLGMILLGDWYSGALVGKTVIALIAPLTALAIGLAGRRYFSTAAGVLAAVLYLGTPWIARVSMTGLVDGVVGFYGFLSVYALLLACGIHGVTGDNRDRQTDCGVPPGGKFVLAGFLAGASVACKYPALLFVLVPLTAWVGLRIWTYRAVNPYMLKCFSIFILAAVAGCGPWFVKNFLLTGNPTYPLLYDWFGGESRTDELNERWRRAHRPRPYPDSGAASAYSLRQVGLYAGHVFMRSEWLAPALVPLSALAFFAVGGRQRKLVMGLLVYLVFVFAAWWLVTHRIDRFWVPILPIVALLAGVGCTWHPSRAWRIGVLVVVSISAAYGIGCMTSGVVTAVDRRFFVDLDVLRRDPLRVDGTHLYLNQRRHSVGTVLLVGDAQPFDLEVNKVLYNTTFDPSQLVNIVSGRNAEEVHEKLLSDGITHIYVRWGEIDRYRSPGNYGFAPEVRPEVFQRLLLAGVLVALGDPDSEGRFRLYKVNPTPRTESSVGAP